MVASEHIISTATQRWRVLHLYPSPLVIFATARKHLNFGSTGGDENGVERLLVTPNGTKNIATVPVRNPHNRRG